MSSERCALLQAAAAILASAALVGCDSLSDVGDQKNLSPTAVAEVVGYDAPSAYGNVTTDVRAQTELLLTGKDSVEADKPILSFLWQATNAAAEAATVTVRNTSTVAVSVPAVAAATNTWLISIATAIAVELLSVGTTRIRTSGVMPPADARAASPCRASVLLASIGLRIRMVCGPSGPSNSQMFRPPRDVKPRPTCR